MPRTTPRPSAPRTKSVGNRSARYVYASLLVLLLGLACLASGPLPFTSRAAGPGQASASGRALSLEERVAYQRAVEEVYWRHTEWPAHNQKPKPGIDEAVPREATRAKVEDTLRKSDALARLWGSPVTAEQLQAEVARMARETKRPGVLRELWQALDNDPFIVAEVLARPALVERRARTLFSTDERIHGPLRERAAALLSAHTTPEALGRAGESYRVVELVKTEAKAGAAVKKGAVAVNAEEWNAERARLAGVLGGDSCEGCDAGGGQLPLGVVSGLQETEDSFYVTSVLAGTKSTMKVAQVEWPKVGFDSWWSGEGAKYATTAEAAGFDYRLAEINSAAADDKWSPTRALPVTTGSAAVWTGSEVIIWGGLSPYGGRTNAGARYNPATDTWTPTSTVGAPRARSGHAAYWTGTEMLIWGGIVGVNCAGDGPCRNDITNTGGRYNPLTDTWTPTSTAGAPFTSGLTVWTGSKLLVWDGTYGYTYDPASDTWKTTARAAFTGPGGHRAVWTGREMFVWGGINNDLGTRGALYNPETNTWRQPNTFNAPSERNNFSMVWTGSEVVVWGGFEGNDITLNTGGRYNPATDTWTPTSTLNAPDARYGHVAVWTGSEMIVHGGDLRTFGQLTPTNTGGRYNPADDSWAPISTVRSPSKFMHVAVWTGTEVFVWGGNTGSGTFQKEGARFNPSNDTWTPAGSNDSPLYLDRGVWTGAEMLVWGQNSLCNGCSSTGARYDPATNVWRPMNLAGAPTAGSKGYGTNAVWTGTEMIVWGGGQGRYNPLTDSWRAVSTAGAPLSGWTAVWSGKEMIVWGSNSTQGGADTGGRYNPETDTWRPTSTAGAPAGRYMHTAVWSGSEMVVWGGATAAVAGRYNTGGRYNPETDTWRPTSTAGAPEARTHHTAIWTGSEMVVWGGTNDAVPATESRINTGGRYDPATDTWTPTATAGAPQARADHRAVWTGSQMIVWGGIVKGVALAEGTYTGGRYNPATDTWTPTSTLSAPSRRSQHVQVWTGTQMIVWGGTAAEGSATHGAVYNAPGAARAGNLPPAVSLTAPAGGTSYQSGDTVQLAAEVSDPDGAVTAVRFYADAQLVGTDTQAPFAFAWNDVRGGDYALTATAADDGNAEGRSAEVNISVTPSTAPPLCVLTAPADGSTYAYGSSVRMEAAMTPNRDRAIARVEFLVDGQTVTYYEPPTYNPPYSHLYTANAAGARSLAARCTDNRGGVTTSAPRVVNVEEQGFSISGQVMEGSTPIANVRLRLDGPAGTAPVYMTTTVGGMGNYFFGGLKPGQTYTVTAEAPGFRFNPDRATYPDISGSKTGQHIIATRVGKAITGRLTDASGAPIYPASVYLSGSKNAYTNVGSDGTYFFYGLEPGGTYTVQPYKNLHTFEPGHRTFANLSADQTADFKGTMQGRTVTVSGRVVGGNGAGVAGMVVKLSTSNERTATTGADGRYSFPAVPYGVNIGVYPSDPTNTHRFTPVSQFKANVAQDYVVPDFVAVPMTYIISGAVRDGAGQVIPGVTVTLSGAASGTTLTSSTDGSYLFRDLPAGGDYTVRPSKQGYAFTPQAATFNALSSNQPADFRGEPAATAHTVGGRVTLSAAPLAGVTVTLSGSQSATATTDAAGEYRFPGLPSGGSYTVTASKAGHTFEPPSATFANLSADRAADFSATSTTPPAERINYALASNGSVATASTEFRSDLPAAAVNDGDRRSQFMPDGRYNFWHSGAGAKPDWIQVQFTAPRVINEVSVVTLQDNFADPAEPTEQMTFRQYGVRDFEVRYWDGSAWATLPGASVTGNDRVLKKFSFPAVTTDRVRVVVRGTADGWSRVMEVEAWGGGAAPAPTPTPTPTPTPSPSPTPAPGERINHALASNGAVVTASSEYRADLPAAAVNDGDRRSQFMPDGRYNFWHSGAGAKPDWLEISFAGARAIDEVSVVTLQDNFTDPAEPTEQMTFRLYGITAYEVQHWNGSAWVTLPSAVVSGNDRVLKKFNFPAVTTSKIRLVVRGAADGWSRVMEVEAWGGGTPAPAPSPTPPPQGRTNHALASNGATATASSEFRSDLPAAAAINGDRRSQFMADGRYNFWHSGAGGPKPDWLEVRFAGTRTITEVDVVTLQDNFTDPAEPTEAMTFSAYGVRDFDVQFWDGSAWVSVPGGSVSGNDRVLRRLTFPALTTDRVRVVVRGATDGWSRIMEVEAY